MHSCIYKGQVSHQRFEPRPHSFSYSLFMMYLDLDELPTLFDNYLLWKIEKPALASFRRNDHYGDKSIDLKTMIRNLIKDKTGTVTDGPIRLLTHFRYAGHIFNPISVYYCFSKHDEQLTHVVAEVTNTPWKEKHCYVLPIENNEQSSSTPAHKKEFHVSPFMDMNMDYHWKVHAPDQFLKLNIESITDNKKMFNASMQLKRIEINSKHLASTLINFPLMTIKVVAAIHFEALKLWLKGIQYIPHPKNHS